MAEEDMKKETDQIDYVILGDAPKIMLEGKKVPGYQERKDREAMQLVESTLLQISREKARFSLLGPRNVFDRNGFTSDGAIAKLLAKDIPVDDAAVEKHEIKSEEDFVEDATTAGGKAFVAAESTSDPVIKSRLENFVKKIVKETSAFLAEPKKKALGAVAILATVATACSAKVSPTVSPEPEGIKTQTSLVLPTQVPTSTETATATQVPTSTETATATENPAETANPFDRSTFPAEFQKDPATMNEQEQTDYQTFLNAARENFIKNQGLQDKVDQMKVNGKFNLDFLDLMAMFYAQNNPDQLKNPELAKGKDVVVGPAEIREALQEGDTNIVNLWRKPFKDDKGLFRQVAYGWYGASPINPEYQKIITFGVVTEIQHYDYGIYGILGGISSIDSDPNTKILWVIVIDSSNNLYLAPRIVNLGPGSTLSGSAGVTCRDNTTAEYAIPPNMSFGPTDIGWTQDMLYGILGKPVNIGSYWDHLDEWSKATGGKPEFSVASECYIKGVPLEGGIQVTEPYFSPPTWEELTSAK